MFHIGLDTVAISRFAEWHTYSPQRLSKLFSAEEITYALSVPAKTAERFAVRFAAREALYKALHSMHPEMRMPFLTVARNISVGKHPNGAPFLRINWSAFAPYCSANTETTLGHTVSLSHTHDTATAMVLLWNQTEKRSEPTCA